MARVVFPDAPGIDSWADCAVEALGLPQPAAL